MKPNGFFSNWNWLNTIFATIVAAGVLLGWAYWTTFLELAEEWSKNPLYSHGYLVPVFALALLWLRRDQMPRLPFSPSWWALPVLLTACGMRLGAAYFYFAWPDRGSLLLMLAATALAIGGWAAFRWTWPSIIFLGFMIPFPGFVESFVTRPLQRVATLCSTNTLQTFGFFAQADGNVIVLSEVDMGIVEACAGMNMLSTFVALTVGACFVLDRPIWQKVLIGLSSLPIAVLCNIARISTTGVLHEVYDHRFAESFHDGAGWMMMPLALLMLLGEVRLLDFVFVIETKREEAAPVEAPLSRTVPLLAQRASGA